MAAGVWDDYNNFITSFIPKQTILKLRLFADKLTVHSGINLHLKSQERKSDLVDKIRTAFNTLRKSDNQRAYLIIRRECEQIAANNPRHRGLEFMPPPTFGGVPSSSNFTAPSSSRQPTLAYSQPRPAGTSGWNQVQGVGATSNAYSHPRQYILQDWRESPMWKPIKALSHMEMLPDIQSSESSNTRREKRVHFQLPNDVIELLKKSKSDPRSRPQYSIRLFCASSEWFRPQGLAAPPGAPPVTNRSIPIEYPSSPDVLLDDQVVPFKERGLRGKAGSAPPLDIDKSPRGLVMMPGRMATVTMSHTGPTPVSKKKEFSKKFWFQLVVCEMTSMEDLLTRLEALPPTNAAAEREKLRKLAAEDDDIEVGSSALSLKDPLSGMRIAKPIRSIRCGHLQCFDARWWLESNKSHPQWLCPHCSKELKFEEVICDGYFLSILSAVPDDYDEVTLESNGDWHTADGKYGTAEWVAKNAAPKPAATAAAAATTVSLKRSRSPSMQGTPDKGKRRAIEILSDSDDDDMPILAQPNGHHANGGVSQPSSFRASSSAQPQAAPAVIDLTLSDSDDDEDESDGLVPQRNFQRPGVESSSHGVAGSTAPRPASTALGSDVWDSIPFSSVRDLDDEEWGDFFNARQANGNVNGNGSGH